MAEGDQCRGSVPLGFIHYIKKTWGQEGLDQFIADTGMDPKDIKEGQWYNIESSGIVQEWIFKNKGEEHVVKAGAFTVKNQGIFSYVIRFANIKTILKKAPENHREVFRCGTMEIKIDEDNSARVIMKDTAADEYSCIAWKGALIGALELTNTKGTVKEIQCQLRDEASHCEFQIKW